MRAASTLTQPGQVVPSRVSSVRIFHQAIGAWVADCTLDLPSPPVLPAGKVVLSVGGVSMSGTVDVRGSGIFGPSCQVRIVGGAGAWDSTVIGQDFSNPAGVSSTTVYQQTASLINETIKDLSPVAFGIKFVRSSGPASRVFRDNVWWVDVTGVTNVGPRPAANVDSSLIIKEWDSNKSMLTFACDTLVYPNSTINDPRFDGGPPVILQDIEQVFDESGSTGYAWAPDSGTQTTMFLSSLKAACLEFTRAQYLRVYQYRLFNYQNGDVALQSVTPAAGIPDIIPMSQWTGLAGLTCKLAPSQIVLVAFESADPTLPRIISYSNLDLPLTSSIDATTEVDVGPTASLVKLSTGSDFVALAGLVKTAIADLATWVQTGMSPSGTTGGPIIYATPAPIDSVAATKVKAT